jgi:Raf kinase inhibitor-like YbhB/YbcL family protein
MHMQLTSPAFNNNEVIPPKYTCDAEETIPPLEWKGVPGDAKSLALIVDDPDAPTGLWVHWLLWDISPTETKILEGQIPQDAVQGTNSNGKAAYQGPCPPDREHRYFFKLYALDIELDLPTSTDKEELEEAMVGHVLDHAELIGLYERQA